MKILFIGGTGNISASCVRLAVARGMEVYVLNRGQRPPPCAGVHTLAADIHAPEAVRAALGAHRFDAVANFIAFQPAEIERDFGLFHGRTGQYIFISSTSAYQKPLASPFIDESCPLANPFWQYSRDKIACEERCLQYYREQGFPVTIVRPAHTYATVIPVSLGGWTDYNVVDRMKRGQKVVIHGDGSSLWTVTHAEDFAKGFVGLLGLRQAVGHAFHITSDEVLTWNQIYAAVAAAAGVELRAVHIASDFLVRCDPGLEGTLLGDKATSKVFDNRKIKRFVPEFQATIRFQDGIRETLRWFEADPARRVIRPEKNAFFDRVIAAQEKALQAVGVAEAAADSGNLGAD